MVLLIRIILNGLQVAKKPVWIEASNTMLEQNNQEFFKNPGYVQNDAEPCIYYKRVEESFVIATVYVDDLMIASNDTELLWKRKS